ncbi:MAG: class I SAM-dependent methyltransferase [Planctomycetota bacterium]
MKQPPLPEWKLPPGVPRGVMDYAQSQSVAQDYDAYHADNPLFDFERQVLADEFSPPGRVIDLGCGSGRAVLPLVAAGHRALAVDLSEEMLGVVREKAACGGLPIDCLRANLVELDAVPTGGFDYAMCLFSTLGMIRGRGNRRRALGHFRRVLRPGGKLVLHVHNFWFNLRDAATAWSGPVWVAKHLLQAAATGGVEVGDKYFPYRGVPNFFLHAFRRRELQADLRSVGLSVRRWIPLEVTRRHALPAPWLLPSLRACGWLVVCES